MFDKVDYKWRYRPVLWLAVITFIGFVSWASWAEIEQQVRGEGRVIPSGKARLVQHLEGGIVEKILIEEGQTIEVGEPLYHISNEKAKGDLQELRISLASYEIKIERLKAERDDQSKFRVSAEYNINYPSIVRAEEQLFTSRRSSFREKMESMDNRYKQKSLRLSDLKSTVENLTKEKSIAEEQLNIKKRLFEAGAMSRSQYLEAESRVKDFETRISKVQKEIPVIVSERSEEKGLMEETRQNYYSEVLDDLNEAQLNYKKIFERIRSIEDQVTRTSVKSPINGIVNKIHVNTVGGVVQPGQVMAEIIPIDETLIIEGRISTEDRGKVWPGLPVTVKITAYDYTLYGGIDGTLTNISADSFLDQQNTEYYNVFIELKKDSLADGRKVFPGMIADLSIKVGKISVLRSILKPFLEIRANALREK
ncbi:MAG: hypothetical protein CMP22_04180 [Rickettsiales bacterium]|nr:hypothetical protein [Rickettsiales bacterium]